MRAHEQGKTFRPQRAVPDAAGTKGAGGRIMRTVQATMKATLGGGDLANAVKCPQGEDKNEWIAVNTVQFYNAASLIYGTVVQYCTPATCPTMAAGKAEYLCQLRQMHSRHHCCIHCLHNSMS